MCRTLASHGNSEATQKKNMPLWLVHLPCIAQDLWVIATLPPPRSPPLFRHGIMKAVGGGGGRFFFPWSGAGNACFFFFFFFEECAWVELHDLLNWKPKWQLLSNGVPKVYIFYIIIILRQTLFPSVANLLITTLLTHNFCKSFLGISILLGPLIAYTEMFSARISSMIQYSEHHSCLCRQPALAQTWSLQNIMQVPLSFSISALQLFSVHSPFLRLFFLCSQKWCDWKDWINS